MSKDIKLNQIEGFKENYLEKDLKTVQNSIVKNGLYGATDNLEVRKQNTPVFSVEIETDRVCNQKQTGRCWMFAALNTFRHQFLQNKKAKNFEFSQNYTFFWDKLEKSNYFYENVLATANQAIDDQYVEFLFRIPQQDGGQWDMIVSIFKKYGIVPQSAMPETNTTGNSRVLNAVLNKKLRKDGLYLRKLVEEGKAIETIHAEKEKCLNEIYRLLCLSLGTPPERFNFEYKDEDKNYHIDQDITPVEFFNKYVDIDLDEYISIINAPTPDKPFNKTYTVDMLGNVQGGNPVLYLNLEMETLKDLAVKQLQAGETIWFGCDVGKSSDTHAEQGIMAMDLFELDHALSIDLDLSKADQLISGESLMTHAMVLTGVDIVDGKSTKWKVENSWGKKIGFDGYNIMSDDWMDQYTYQVVINKKFLTEEQKALIKQEPIVLKPWDPMGSLA